MWSGALHSTLPESTPPMLEGGDHYAEEWRVVYGTAPRHRSTTLIDDEKLLVGVGLASRYQA